MASDSSAFASIANLRLPAASRLLPSSWCPDKDLLVIVTRSGSKDKLSLWRMQGAKKWEVSFDGIEPASEEVVDIAWSPDGMSIAVAHRPPAITVHSIEKGSQQVHIPIGAPESWSSKRLEGIWWLRDPKPQVKSTFPDLFKRRGDITGSAYSILKTQPLLDPLHDELQTLTSTELFAFQGANTQASNRNLQPPVISTWPSLAPDPIAASLKPAKSAKQPSRPGEEYDEPDDTNINSLLVAANNYGDCYCFLDGRYSMGYLSLGDSHSVASLHQDDERALLIFTRFTPDKKCTSLHPSRVRLPFLKQRYLRDVARASSSTKELTWYALRVVKEMNAAWFGSDTQSGARELGPKWLTGLEDRQRDQFGESEPNPVADLTRLLCTGRATEALSDYLGSGEMMSERGLLKWDQTVSEALVKLRDYAEKRLIPACQRIHLLLEEVLAWSRLPQYAFCDLMTENIERCLDLAHSIIMAASWLAATARRELLRFRDFLNWVRYEVARANPAVDSQHLPPPRHDPLEVNDYLKSSLASSSIDKWFTDIGFSGLSPEKFFIPAPRDLNVAIQAARSVLSEPGNFGWPPKLKEYDFSRLDRNLGTLMMELATQCHRIFIKASSTVSLSAVVDPAPLLQPGHVVEKQVFDAPAFVRERTITSSDGLQQYLAMQAPDADKGPYLCLIRTSSQYGAPEPVAEVAVAVLHCVQQTKDGTQPLHVLDSEFFDERLLIVVYRQSDSGPAYIATIDYAGIDCQSIDRAVWRDMKSREEAMNYVLQRVRAGELAPATLPINQTRILSGCREGPVTLSVNGRAGRRVACVLDDAGLSLEILDMEGGEEEEEEEEGDISEPAEVEDEA